VLHDAYQDSKRQDERGLACICLQLHANQAGTVGMRAERLTEGILEQILVNRPANRKTASGHPTAKSYTRFCNKVSTWAWPNYSSGLPEWPTFTG
jgi:hypothetical protein